MYSVEVHADLIMPGSHTRITRYLVFESFSSATNCVHCLRGTRPHEYTPKDYFEAAKLTRDPVGQVVNEHSIETDWVITYLEKSDK